MLSFLRGLLSTGQQNYASVVALFSPPAWPQALRQPDGRVEILAEMEKVKNLCDNYERKLDDTEKKLGESRKDLEAAQVKLHAEQERATLWEGRAKEARSEATYMRSQVMLLNRRALESQAEAKELAEESAQATKARAMVEEKNRRLEEILKETRKIEDLVSKENKGLVAKLARLQKWTECMDDDEVRRTMRQLYQELENWIKRHLLGSLPKHDGDEPSMSYKVQTLHETQTDVYGLIFHSILRQFFVAIYDEQFESLFRKLDQEVLAHCMYTARLFSRPLVNGQTG